MSSDLASSFHLQSSSKPLENANGVSTVFEISTPHTFAASVESLSAGPSTWRNSFPTTAPAFPSKRPQIVKNRTSEELEIIERTHARLSSCLASDHALALNPDTDAPFLDTTDVLRRLLPYHVFLQPQEDLDILTSNMKGKGKAKETELEKELRETKFALECHKRRDALVKRFRDIQTRQGKRTASDDQAVLVASLVLDVERSDTTLLSNELRTARAEHERREKERRMAAHVARPAYYGPGPVPTSAATAVSTQYYRGYPYAYAQVYGSSAQTSSTPAAFSVPSTPLVSSPVPTQSAIPVQLPVASLPALHALGIVPVPAASLAPDGQPQPAAILRGSSSNGSMLSLEINVSLLQSAQMSGLAMVLNSLMSKSNPSVNGSTLDTQHSSGVSGNEAT